jgi:RNA polymerase subunit RPABC4/transcription elongation factor Spt4
MALISCPECAQQLSDRAPTCPHCGCPIAAPVSVSQTARPPSGRKCEHCKSEVDPEATVCPFCGRDLPAPATYYGCIIMLIIMGGYIALMVIGMLVKWLFNL